MDYFTISNNWFSWFTTFIQINIRERGDRLILHFWFQYYQKFVYSYIIQKKKMLLIYTTHTKKNLNKKIHTVLRRHTTTKICNVCFEEEKKMMNNYYAVDCIQKLLHTV